VAAIKLNGFRCMGPSVRCRSNRGLIVRSGQRACTGLTGAPSGAASAGPRLVVRSLVCRTSRLIDPTQPPVLIAGSSLAARVEPLVTTLRGGARYSSIERSLVSLPLNERRRARWKTPNLEAVKACHRLRFGTPERQAADRERRVANGTSVRSPQFERA
jgi:hypothetical protein